MHCAKCNWEPLKRSQWEVVDVDEPHVFLCETKEGRDAFVNAIELMGHRANVKEVIS